MESIPYSTVRQHMKTTMDKVCQEHSPILITRQRASDAVVMMSLSDYQALEETAYLFRTPANAKRLQESIAQVDQHQTLILPNDLDV